MKLRAFLFAVIMCCLVFLVEYRAVSNFATTAWSKRFEEAARPQAGVEDSPAAGRSEGQTVTRSAIIASEPVSIPSEESLFAARLPPSAEAALAAASMWRAIRIEVEAELKLLDRRVTLPPDKRHEVGRFLTSRSYIRQIAAELRENETEQKLAALGTFEQALGQDYFQKYQASIEVEKGIIIHEIIRAFERDAPLPPAKREELETYLRRKQEISELAGEISDEELQRQLEDLGTIEAILGEEMVVNAQ